MAHFTFYYHHTQHRNTYYCVHKIKINCVNLHSQKKTFKNINKMIKNIVIISDPGDEQDGTNIIKVLN